MAERKIKLIWDFRGPTAPEIARHHEIHLKEYISKAGDLNPELTGYKDLSEMHSLAYMVVEENQLQGVRDALRPHRGEIFEE